MHTLRARVLTQGGTFSLPTQFREGPAGAYANDYEVIAEVADEGGKDSKRAEFDRPGMERVFDLCESRRVGVVVSQERSRFGECPVPEMMISYRLAESGTGFRTLPDSGGEAGERTRRVYEVEERRKEVVRAIFRMVGAEGYPTPVKEKHKDRAWSWRHRFIRHRVLRGSGREAAQAGGPQEPTVPSCRRLEQPPAGAPRPARVRDPVGEASPEIPGTRDRAVAVGP